MGHDPAEYRLHRDPRSSHQLISRLLKQRRPRAILDVGAARGLLGRALQGSGLILDAIEPNPQWAAGAGPFYRQVFARTAEQAELPKEEYDAIVCADVLEHVPDPVAVLWRLRWAAAPGAMWVVCVPNVAHLALRLMLLFGRFPAMERGPLDRTHLHFYTRSTAEQMLNQGGLEVTGAYASSAPLDELWARGQGRLVFRMLMAAQHSAVALAPGLMGYQWVLIARALPT